jgi:hypothetical protein
VTLSNPVHTGSTETKTAVSNIITTLSEIRITLAADTWPSRGLAVRAGILATSETPDSLLLRIADGRPMRAAQLWLRIAYYLDDGEQLIAALSLATQCAYIGGNHSFTRNCISRAEAAARHNHVELPAVIEHLKRATNPQPMVANG